MANCFLGIYFLNIIVTESNSAFTSGNVTLKTLPFKLSKCWKAGNNFQMQIFQFKKIAILKLFLLFNIIKHSHKAFFLSGYRGSKCQAIKKCFVSAVPVSKPFMSLMQQINKQTRIIVISGLRGIILWLPVRLNIRHF